MTEIPRVPFFIDHKRQHGTMRYVHIRDLDLFRPEKEKGPNPPTY